MNPEVHKRGKYVCARTRCICLIGESPIAEGEASDTIPTALGDSKQVQWLK